MRRQWKLYLLALSLVLVVGGSAPAQRDDGVTFTTIDPPGAIYAESGDINPSGEIVGRYYDGSNCTLPCEANDGHNHGYLLSGGEFTTIDFPGAAYTSARGINPQGDIVGNYRSADGKFHGYLLSGGEFTTIDFPGAAETTAWKINPAGDIAGRYTSTDGKSHVFLLSGGEFTSIDFPGAFDTAPQSIPFVGINARGDIVSSYCDAAPCTPANSGHVHGLLLSNGEFASIDFPGAAVTAASGINSRGDIVGAYIDTNGQAHGYILSRRERDNEKD